MNKIINGKYMRRIAINFRQIVRKMTLLVILLASLFTLMSCDSKIRDININGTYYGTGTMGYEAVVENGTITIYNTSFFNKEVYWYGTCHANELNADNKLISQRLEREKSRSFYDDFFGNSFFGRSMNESRASEKEILFTEDSLTFVYDFSGMAVSQVTLYKETNKKRQNDSNAIEVPETETYEPYVIPRDDNRNKPNDENKGNKNDETTKGSDDDSSVVLPEGDVYSL